MYRVIFEHHPKEGQEAKFIAAWQKGSDIIQKYPGARGTKLFRSLNDPATLYAMAEWENKAARDAAMDAIAALPNGEDIIHGQEQFLDSYKTIVSAELVAASDPN